MGIQKSFVYTGENLTLDRYIVVEPGETWRVYNWTQHYAPETLETELQDSGFVISSMQGDLTGAESTADDDYSGVIANAL